jgi:hypothetical protein
MTKPTESLSFNVINYIFMFLLPYLITHWFRLSIFSFILWVQIFVLRFSSQRLIVSELWFHKDGGGGGTKLYHPAIMTTVLPTLMHEGQYNNHCALKC